MVAVVRVFVKEGFNAVASITQRTILTFVVLILSAETKYEMMMMRSVMTVESMMVMVAPQHVRSRLDGVAHTYNLTMAEVVTIAPKCVAMVLLLALSSAILQILKAGSARQAVNAVHLHI